MNTFKIQSDALKSLLKKKQVLYGGIYEGAAVIGTSSFLAFIPECEFYLDTKIKAPFNIKGFMEPVKNKIRVTADASYTVTRMVEGRNMKLVKVYSASNPGFYAYLDEKHTKYFDGKYRIDTPRSPVTVYEHDTLVGVIMPVFINENEEV